MANFLWVCLGGALGSGSRYLISGWALKLLGAAFPYGTLAVNVLGSFVICLLMYLGLTAEVISPTVRLFLTTGFCGGLTTYSTFDYETMRLAQQGAWTMAILNVGLTVLACFVAGYLGESFGKLLFRA